MSGTEDVTDVASEVAQAMTEGREVWKVAPFDTPWFIAPEIPECACDITFHDEQNVTLGLRLGCPRHAELALALARSWNPNL